jgi:hypothetical protein
VNQPEPLTAAQSAYISRLLPKVGKPAYQRLKADLGIEPDVTILRLSKNDAARLIRAMILAKNKRGVTR